MDFIKFETNIPVEMAFTHAEGVIKDGQWGEYFFRTTTDGRGVSLKREVESKLLDLEIQPGELVSICKREQKQGQRRSIEWQVKRVDPPGGPAPERPRPVPMQAQPAMPGNTRTAQGAATPVPHKTARPSNPQVPGGAPHAIETAPPSHASQPKPNGTATENFSTERPILHTQVSLTLSACVLAAIDAAQRANEYSLTVGFPLKFGEDHIQAWASTLYIQHSKAGNIQAMNQRYQSAAEARTVNGGATWPH